jgi:hypothetical protein
MCVTGSATVPKFPAALLFAFVVTLVVAARAALPRSAAVVFESFELSSR